MGVPAPPGLAVLWKLRWPVSLGGSLTQLDRPLVQKCSALRPFLHRATKLALFSERLFYAVILHHIWQICGVWAFPVLKWADLFPAWTQAPSVLVWFWWNRIQLHRNVPKDYPPEIFELWLRRPKDLHSQIGSPGLTRGSEGEEGEEGRVTRIVRAQIQQNALIERPTRTEPWTKLSKKIIFELALLTLITITPFFFFLQFYCENTFVASWFKRETERSKPGPAVNPLTDSFVR